MTSEMDRPSSPKRSCASVTASGDVKRKKSPGVPPNGLPIWERLPLDAKLPMVASPRNAVVLYTTNLCEKIHKSSRNHGFILTDPESRFLSNDYKPLHDPHLRVHLSQQRMKYRLYRGGFITKDGKVLCTLKEFNQYRQYLRRIHLENLSHEKRKRDEKLKSKSFGSRLYPPATGDTSYLHRAKEVRRRLKEQYETDKERYNRIMLETEARRERMNHEKLSKMTETERKRVTERARREAMMKKQELRESRRKMHIHRKWLIEDEMRRARADERRLEREIELQTKLEEAWSLRKQVQQKRIQDEENARQREEDERKKNIQAREISIMKQRKRHEAMFQKMQEQARKEREKQEAIWRRRLEKEIEKRRASQTRKKKKSRRVPRGPLSIWSLPETLKKDTVHRKYSKEELGVTDLRGAKFSKECIVDKEAGKTKTKSEEESLVSSDSELRERCNFACLTSAYMKRDEIPLSQIVDKRLVCLQREIKPKQSASSINLVVDEELSSEESSQSIRVSPPAKVKGGRVKYLRRVESGFKIAVDRLASSMETVASFIVDWSVNVARMRVSPGASAISSSLCEQCEKDLMRAYCSSSQVSEPYSRPESPVPLSSAAQSKIEDEELENLERAAMRGVRFSLVEETIPGIESLPPIEAVEVDDDEIRFPKLRDSLTKLPCADSRTSIEGLVNNLSKLLEDLVAGKLLPSAIEQLEIVTKEILEGAATVAASVSGVAPEEELAADAGKKRSAVLIEALISQTVNEALEEVTHSSKVTKTSSELLGDLIGYTLNEAVDDSKTMDETHLVRHDIAVIRNYLQKTMQRALHDMDNQQLSTEGLLVADMIQNTMATLTTDIKESRLPIKALENIAMAIIRSNDIIKQTQSDAKVKAPAEAKGPRGFEFIRTALLSLIEVIDKKGFTGKEVAAMADRLCSSIYDPSDDGGFKRLSSPASVSVMSSFVKEVINNCLNQLTDDTADRIVNHMLGEAVLSQKPSTDEEAAVAAMRNEQDVADATPDLGTFIQNNVLNKSLDDSNNDTEISSPSYLSGAKSETLLLRLIESVLSGRLAKDTTVDKPRKPPVKKASITDLVMDSFVKSVMNCAMERCQTELDSNGQKAAVREDPAPIISTYISEVLSKSKELAASQSPGAPDSDLTGLVKDVSSSLVAQVNGKKSTEKFDEQSPKKSSSVDLYSHTHLSHSEIFSDEASDEEKEPDVEELEVEITPVLRSNPIDLDPEEIAPSLAAISMRASMAGHLAHRFEATARNSFASLIHPDLSRVRGLKKDSASDIKRKLHDVYIQSKTHMPADDCVIVADEVHAPGEVSSSSSSEEDENEEVKAVEDCAAAKPEDGEEPTKKTSSLRAISPAHVAKSTSGTQKSSCSPKDVSRSPSGNQSGRVKSSSSIKSVTSTPSRVRSSSGSKVNLPAVKSSSEKENVQKTPSTPSTKIPSRKSSGQVTPKSSQQQQTTSATKIGGSATKIRPVRSKASVGSTGKTVSKEASKSSSVGSTRSLSNRCNSAIPTPPGTKKTPSKTSKTPSGGSVVELKPSGGRAGPAETGSINDLRTEKEMKRTRSGQRTSQVSHDRPDFTTKERPPTKTSSDSKMDTGRGPKSRPFASTSGSLVPGMNTPSSGIIEPQTLETGGKEAPRVRSDGEIVEVRSLYGTFSSTVQIRSNTDVQNVTSSGSKVDTASPAPKVSPKVSGSGH